MTGSLAPEPSAVETAAETSCGSCGRPLRVAPVSRVFRTWHERCLERAVWQARAEVRED